MSIQRQTCTISYRDSNDQVVEMNAAELSAEMLRNTLPWRTFRWFHGQCHYSGSYWSATESAHVIYESRLELSRLLMADFDNSVTQIRAQPFQIKTRVDGRAVRHVPDYWLLRQGVPPTVVAVKPAGMLEDPAIKATFPWVREEIESKGWKFEIASEQPAAQLVNVRFLSGFRRPETISVRVLEELRCLHIDGLAFAEAIRLITCPEPLVRAALLHMLWRHELEADLSVVMSSKTVLHKAVAA